MTKLYTIVDNINRLYFMDRINKSILYENHSHKNIIKGEVLRKEGEQETYGNDAKSQDRPVFRDEMRNFTK